VSTRHETCHFLGHATLDPEMRQEEENDRQHEDRPRKKRQRPSFGLAVDLLGDRGIVTELVIQFDDPNDQANAQKRVPHLAEAKSIGHGDCEGQNEPHPKRGVCYAPESSPHIRILQPLTTLPKPFTILCAGVLFLIEVDRTDGRLPLLDDLDPDA